jgi:hypothetical protein
VGWDLFILPPHQCEGWEVGLGSSLKQKNQLDYPTLLSHKSLMRGMRSIYNTLNTQHIKLTYGLTREHFSLIILHTVSYSSF